MILWRNLENYPFFYIDSDPRFPPFLLYVRWKSGVNFLRRCFRDEMVFPLFLGCSLYLKQLKYFDDFTCLLSGERSFPFGFLNSPL